MKVYRNKKNGSVLLSGKILHLQLCRASNVLVPTIIQASRRIFFDIWDEIDLKNGVVPSYLSHILKRPSGNDDLQNLHNWLSKNKEILENIYYSAKLASVIDTSTNLHLRKIN